MALPDQLFYNTGISTYFWILSNRKRPERRGKVVLVDARKSCSKMRKSLGDKRKYLTPEQIDEVTRLYDDALDMVGEDNRVKIFDNEDFGYQRITVERPLRRRWEITAETLEALTVSKAWLTWDSPNLVSVKELVGTRYDDEAACSRAIKKVNAPAAVAKELVKLAAVADPEASVITDKTGNPLPDSDLRDQENVHLAEDVDEYVKREVLPYAADAWVDLKSSPRHRRGGVVGKGYALLSAVCVVLVPTRGTLTVPSTSPHPQRSCAREWARPPRSPSAS